MNKQAQAFALAQKAAMLDFESAMRGLLAGQKAALEEMQQRLDKTDRAMLMALALTERGARLDKDGFMVQAIAEGLRGRSLAPVEKQFLERADAMAAGADED